MIYKTEMITVDGAVGFTAATIASAKSDMENVSLDGNIKQVVCTVETDQIRVRVDGTDPTASVGHLLNAGDVFRVVGDDVLRFRAIKVTAAAKIAASYEV